MSIQFQGHLDAPSHTREPGEDSHEPSRNPLDDASRRNSISTTGVTTAAAASNGVSDEKSKDFDEKPILGAAPATATGTAATLPSTKSMDTDHGLSNRPAKWEDRRKHSSFDEDQDHHEWSWSHWSRGKKICMIMLIVGILICVIVAILVAFMVKTPDVSYKSAEVLCENDDYVRCARDHVQVRVYLELDNPNIIGVTANAELGLFKEDRTFLGPGTVNDTDVNALGKTDLIAVFNITSDRAYDILLALFIPPTRDVTVLVDGTIFLHVGLLRPSLQFQESFQIPAQDITSVVGGLLGNADTPSVSDVGDAIVKQLPDVGGVPVGDAVDAISDNAGTVVDTAGSVADSAGSIVDATPSVADTASSVASTVGDAASAAGISIPPISDLVPRSKSGVLAKVVHRNLFRQKRVARSLAKKSTPFHPRKFAQALLEIGAPLSNTRQYFDEHRARLRAVGEHETLGHHTSHYTRATRGTRPRKEIVV